MPPESLDSITLTELLNLGPYGLLILALWGLWRFLTTTVWPYYTETASERWRVVASAVSDIQQLRAELSISSQMDRNQLEEIDRKLDKILDSLIH